MSNASNYLEEAILNHFFRNTPVTAPAQVFLALYKTNPTDFDSGTEISGAGYQRQQISFTSPTQSAGASEIKNSGTISFPPATSDWTTGTEAVSFWGIRTSLSGGNLLAYGEFLDESKPNNGKYSVTRNDVFNIGDGKLSIQFNSKASYWLQSAVFNHFFRNTPVTSPSQIFLGLYKTEPTSSDTGVEITFQGYNRQLLSFGAPNQEVIINNTDINFPIPDVDIGTVRFFAIRDAVTGGNLLASGAWSIAKNISQGMQFSVAAGNIEVSVS